MIKILLLSSALLFTLLTNAQESILFQIGYHPNKIYSTEMETNSDSEIDFIASEETLALLKGNGMKLPLKVQQNTIMSLTNSTQNSMINGDTPAIIEYGDMITQSTVNGVTTSEKKPYSGMKIKGAFNDQGSFEIDTIIGNQVTSQMRNILRTTLKNIQQQVKFPEVPISIGDNFQNNIPLTIPLEGMAPIHAIINTTYHLLEIRDDIAIFDTQLAISLDSSQEQFNIEASGSGSGLAKFNYKENYFLLNESEMPMNISVQIREDLTMKMKSVTRTTLKVTME
ncbi:hypothetical protein [Zeaxanthinibacter enoshimensis]|uniref:Gliding motility-associated protein GldM C-terminal domain-containing protein n=1 Tax=Zeaxanthinibacter enoshimensis TaxID=392009 RepID=A0A4R6THZ6_9FLAO|nr:hypothetical protein [Zeaxanthinibacter enoshimensis]TDQ28137.1 hypothetical protein CLV82_2979 [Zeaxanthinibacter enoshimensis]